jgi:hypothetical protein
MMVNGSRRLPIHAIAIEFDVGIDLKLKNSNSGGF